MRPKGSGKTPGSGRKKGTPNKDVLPLEQKAQELGVDPFEILLHFASGNWKALGYDAETRTYFTAAGIEAEEPIIKPEHRLKAATEACSYIHAKRKAVEMKVELDPNDDRPLRDLSDEELDSY